MATMIRPALAAALCALAACSAPRPDVASLVPAAWTEPAAPLRIVGPIHYVGTRELGAYLITTPSGHILLDGALPGSEPLIEASIAELGFSVEDIRILLISHAHADHVGTLAHFQIPEAGILLILAVDHFLDMGRTATNVIGNAVAATVVARWEGQLDAPQDPDAEIVLPHAPLPGDEDRFEDYGKPPA